MRLRIGSLFDHFKKDMPPPSDEIISSYTIKEFKRFNSFCIEHLNVFGHHHLVVSMQLEGVINGYNV